MPSVVRKRGCGSDSKNRGERWGVELLEMSICDKMPGYRNRRDPQVDAIQRKDKHVWNGHG